MTPTVLYYAIGGGLGHLTRAVAFLRQHDLAEVSLILSASQYLDDPRCSDGIATLRVPDSLQHAPQQLRAWLTQCIAQYQPRLICVDSFPGGILGELCGLAALDRIPLWYLARLLRWSDYAPLLREPSPHFAKTWRLELLHPMHAAFIQQHSDEVCDVLIAATPRAEPCKLSQIDRYWLVLHSGPADEVAQLVAYADEMRRIETNAITLIVATHHRPSPLPENCLSIDVYPATALIQRAERIISAAGFNVMRETASVRQRHYFLPFPRRFDDQFERARRARKECSQTSH